jgi:LDH2 family malate/lactate/ureidoglycolate dehydrogenase
MSEKSEFHYINADKLRDFCTEALTKADVNGEDAALTADTMVEADLRGIDTHGVVRLAPYIRMLNEGNMNPRPKITNIKETPTTAVIDADDGIGNVVSVRATEMAIEKARNSGVGIVGVRNSTHNGMLAYYVMMAMKQDMIGLMTTNAPQQIPAYGGVTKILSTNPYAAAVPAGEELPVVIDMATTVVAGGKVRLYANMDRKIPIGWGLDRSGRPTDDPKEVLADGFLAWLGGAKGYSLAVLANILSGVLTGGPFGPATFGPYSSVEYGSQLFREGHFVMALNIDNFIPAGEFKNRMDAMIREFKASRPAEGFTEVYLPGEPEFLQKKQRLETGIPLTNMIWQRLNGVKERFGLAGFE